MLLPSLLMSSFIIANSMLVRTLAKQTKPQHIVVVIAISPFIIVTSISCLLVVWWRGGKCLLIVVGCASISCVIIMPSSASSSTVCLVAGWLVEGTEPQLIVIDYATISFIVVITYANISSGVAHAKTKSHLNIIIIIGVFIIIDVISIRLVAVIVAVIILAQLLIEITSSCFLANEKLIQNMGLLTCWLTLVTHVHTSFFPDHFMD